MLAKVNKDFFLAAAGTIIFNKGSTTTGKHAKGIRTGGRGREISIAGGNQKKLSIKNTHSRKRNILGKKRGMAQHGHRREAKREARFGKSLGAKAARNAE